MALLALLQFFRPELVRQIGCNGRGRHQPGSTYVTAPCIEACPIKVDVPRYIDFIKDGKFTHSLGVILQKYPMADTVIPAIGQQVEIGLVAPEDGIAFTSRGLIATHPRLPGGRPRAPGGPVRHRHRAPGAPEPQQPADPEALRRLSRRSAGPQVHHLLHTGYTDRKRIVRHQMTDIWKEIEARVEVPAEEEPAG